MHGREKKAVPSRPSPKQQTKIRLDVLEEYQALIHPKSYDLRARWLSQELNASPSLSIFNPLGEYDIERLCEIFSACIEDIRHVDVANLANDVLLIFCLWQNSTAVLGGTVDKLLVERIANSSCPFQLRESAVRVVTVFHVMDLLRSSKKFKQDDDIESSPNKHHNFNNKFLESFFFILNELVKDAVYTVTREIGHNQNMEQNDIDDVSESDDQSSEDSSESVTTDIEDTVIDPKDSFLEGIIEAWVSLVPLISEQKFDEEFPVFYETFEKLVQHHKNPAIKIVAAEAIITLNDLNERLPIDKQYDVEIQKVVDTLYGFAKQNAKSPLSKKRTRTWLNLARALEADKCVVELPFINIQNKQLVSPTKNQIDKRKIYQNRSRKETFWTNWAEAMTIKYIKNSVGHQFNGLMSTTDFGSKIFSLVSQKDSWHLKQHNQPLSMVYLNLTKNHQTKNIFNGLNNDNWTGKWWKKTNHGQKDNIKSSIRNEFIKV